MKRNGPSAVCCAGAVLRFEGETMNDRVEEIVAPTAIERALAIYQQLQHRDPSVLLQARKDPDPAYLRNG
jgi:hypothetical protein